MPKFLFASKIALVALALPLTSITLSHASAEPAAAQLDIAQVKEEKRRIPRFTKSVSRLTTHVHRELSRDNIGMALGLLADRIGTPEDPRTGKANSRESAHLWTLRGRIDERIGDLESALISYQQALSFRHRIAHAFEAHILHHLARVNHELAKDEDAFLHLEAYLAKTARPTARSLIFAAKLAFETSRMNEAKHFHAMAKQAAQSEGFEPPANWHVLAQSISAKLSGDAGIHRAPTLLDLGMRANGTLDARATIIHPNYQSGAYHQKSFQARGIGIGKSKRKAKSCCTQRLQFTINTDGTVDLETVRIAGKKGLRKAPKKTLNTLASLQYHPILIDGTARRITGYQMWIQKYL